MKKTLFVFLIILGNNSGVLFAQTTKPLEYFPHHKGDVFEYKQPNSTHLLQNIIVKDSLGEDGKYYLETSSNSLFSFNHRYATNSICIDTTEYEIRSRKTNAVIPDSLYSILWIKLNADSGDSWMVLSDSFCVVRAEVTSVFDTLYLGENVKIKVIEYSDTTSDDFTNSTFWLAYKFGIVRKKEGFPYWSLWNLIGAEINDKKYGEVTSVNNSPEGEPKDYYLSSNYPNPFNPATKINFEIPQSGNVIIKIYDINGKEVMQLLNEEKTTGKHTVTFDGSNLSSGIYFCRMQAGNYSSTRKIVLLK